MNWKFITVPDHQLPTVLPVTVKEIENLGKKTYNASVPGSFITDMISAGDLPDLEYSKNILLAQGLEDLHVFYYTEVLLSAGQYLHFEGIDTVSDVYVNGEIAASSDNMFMPLDVDACFKEGKNSVVVHIKPICLESRKHRLPASAVAPFYTQDGIYMRKAISSFGWDILPRAVTAGIHKPVSVRNRKPDSIEDVLLVTARIDKQKKTARLRAYFQFNLSSNCARDYTVEIKGVCNDSLFEKSSEVWHISHSFSIDIDGVQVWNPKNYGEPNLYDISVALYCKGELKDTYNFKYGVRTVGLVHDRSEFKFTVNDTPIFALGSNWVPTSYYPHEQSNRLARALSLLDESGANMVRIWGGGYYEDDEFYDFCDKHGILVWQDFMMACAIYPQEEKFANKIREEACYQIKRLRNHCCIALWCGDNECDQAMVTWSDLLRNPENNIITRRTLPDALNNNDLTRPYLPSSPHIYEGQTQHTSADRHLWTRTEHFASDFYMKTTAKFISEIGYSAFPNFESLNRFLKEPQHILRDDGSATDEYVLHGTAPELVRGRWYDHKVPCAYYFASTVFAPLSEDLSVFVKQSQYTQAEAYKAWIEHSRISDDINGILLWNLLDGWPQVSEAMVDYYFTKKASFEFVKRAQRPVNVILKEESKGVLTVFAVNSGRKSVTVEYSISLNGKEIAAGKTELSSDEKKVSGKITTDGQSNFYKIDFWVDGVHFVSHYQENAKNLDINKYISDIENTYGTTEI